MERGKKQQPRYHSDYRSKYQHLPAPGCEFLPLPPTVATPRVPSPKIHQQHQQHQQLRPPRTASARRHSEPHLLTISLATQHQVQHRHQRSNPFAVAQQQQRLQRHQQPQQPQQQQRRSNFGSQERLLDEARRPRTAVHQSLRAPLTAAAAFKDADDVASSGSGSRRSTSVSSASDEEASGWQHGYLTEYEAQMVRAWLQDVQQSRGSGGIGEGGGGRWSPIVVCGSPATTCFGEF